MQNNNDNKISDKLYKILLKRAEGFFYKEVCEEFVYDNKPKYSNQISFFDEEKSDLTKSKKRVTKTKVNQNHNVKLECNDVSCFASGENCEDIKAPTLAKKKVTTHFVPPDMLAIKMLLEIDKTLGTDLTMMSDSELLSLAKQLEDEIKQKGE
ncbi:MAG: hypothetical protein J5689_02805 [Clostridia bacterium]|nr:hypothetical protein [Clostridia bacterium]